MVTLEQLDILEDSARTAAEKAYIPYSSYRVGAAVLAPDGLIFTGSNIENASYGLTVCAERTAIFKAVSTGVRKLGPLAVTCLDGNPEQDPNSVMPCGACRQVMSEFMDPDNLIMVDGVGYLALKDLLPHPFHL